MCACVCVCTQMRALVTVFMCMCACVCVCVCVSARTHMCIRACTCECVHVCVCLNICVRVLVYEGVCVCLCVGAIMCEWMCVFVNVCVGGGGCNNRGWRGVVITVWQRLFNHTWHADHLLTAWRTKKIHCPPGNYILGQVLPQIYLHKPEPVHQHLAHLVGVVDRCENSDRIYLLQLMGMVAKKEPKVKFISLDILV